MTQRFAAIPVAQYVHAISHHASKPIPLCEYNHGKINKLQEFPAMALKLHLHEYLPRRQA
jgi:hypothetical protein